MDPDIVRRAIATFGAMLLTPLIVVGLSKLFPVLGSPSDITCHQLERRNAWINRLGIVLFFVGLSVGIVSYQFLPNNNPWGVAAGFGYSVILPCVGTSVLCLTIGGPKRLSEFISFYERKYRVGRQGLIWIFSPLIVLGIIATPKIYSAFQATTH